MQSSGIAFRFICVIAITLLILVIPNPSGLPVKGKRALAAFAFTGGIFALQPVSLPFAGLMVPVALVLLGVADSSQVFEPLSKPIIILILGSLFLAEALRKHGISRRLALISIVFSDGDIKKLLLGLMGIAGFLSMWMENTATAAILIPVALSISNRIPDRERANELLILLVMGIAYAASLGGMTTITGSASNAVTSGFLSEIQPWSFLDWMWYGLPAFLFIFPLTFFLLYRLMPVAIQRIDITKAREDLDGMGSLKSVEIEVIATLSVAVIFWIMGPYIENYFKLYPTILSTSVVAVVAVSYLAFRGIIRWEDVKDVSWGLFFAIAAGLALGDALIRTGATGWLANLMKPLVMGPPFLGSLLFLVFMSAFITNIINNATVAAVFVPILISIANYNPELQAVQLVLPLTLATTFGYALPSASGRMALISAMGIVKRRVMVRVGLILTVFSSLLLAFFFYLMNLLGLY